MATPEEIKEQEEAQKTLNEAQKEGNTLAEENFLFQQSIGNEIREQLKSLKSEDSTRKSINSTVNVASKLAREVASYNNDSLGTTKDVLAIDKQINQAKAAELILDIQIGAASGKLQKSLIAQKAALGDTALSLKQMKKESKLVAENFGVKTFAAAEDIAAAIPGLRKFSGAFKEASKSARATAVSSGSSSKAFASGAASLAKAASAALPLLALKFLVDVFSAVDKSSSELARNLGTSSDRGREILENFAKISIGSGKSFINTKNLTEAQLSLGSALGTNAQLSNEILISQTELTKQAGYSIEAANQLTQISLATGSATDDITANFLGQAKALNLTNGLAINEKTLLNDIGKISKGTLATFAGQPKELAKASFAAKKLGVELSKLESIADGFLNIESSISKEFEAEVLTGRQLNLETARRFALDNNIAGVAKEINAQGITRLAFSKMNRIQQEGIASAMNLSRDEMGDMLMKGEALRNVGAENEEALKAQFEAVKGTAGEQAFLNRLGSEQYAQQLKSTSKQEEFAALTERIKDGFVSIAGPLMDMIDPIVTVLLPVISTIGGIISGIKGFFSEIGETIGGFIPNLGRLGKIMAFIAKTAVIFAAYKAYASLATIPVVGAALGIVAAASTVAAGFGLVNSVQSVNDGMAPSSKGPFTITDSFGATAITAQGDGLAVSPNIIREENRNTTPSIDYDQLANAIAMGAERGTSRANITTNLDGARVSNRLQPPLAVNTRKYSV